MGLVTSAETSVKAIEHINRRYMNPSKVWGYHYGFVPLDIATGGIQHTYPRDYIIVAARSGVGKSAFMMSVCLTVAMQFSKSSDKDVRIILLEMDAVSCQMRLASQMTGVPITLINQGEITAQQKAELEKAMRHIGSLPLVYAEGSYNVREIQKMLQEDLHNGRKCGFWALDHVGIVPTEQASKYDPRFSVSEMSRSFQQMCHHIAPGMILAQLNREAAGAKADQEPQAHHIYNSDRFLHDCDKLFLLHRPETAVQYSDEERAERLRSPKPEVAAIIVSKNRNGAADFKVPVLFDRNKAAWRDIPADIIRKLAS